MPKEKIRLDEMVLRLGLESDPKIVRSLILSGSVLVNETPVTKVGTLVHSSDKIRIRDKIKTYVSRGAYKLLGAFQFFNTLDVGDKTCIDLGSSTGGFTQVLLEKHAKQVFAVDVGYGLLAQKIANHPNVIVLDRKHVKDLKWEDLKTEDNEIFISMDLSFISLLAVFSHLQNLFESPGHKISFSGISLIKPQFELHPSKLEKGVVKSKKDIYHCLISVWRNLRKIDPKLKRLGLKESPIQGTTGNREFLLYWKRDC
ncbi:TlyA family RNA methyltransferase [Leptospira sp. 96542]|nr:TlyA family RNA methyltransferase [Leptospira sp. 96542]